MAFEYVAYDENCEISRGLLGVESAEAAQEILWGMDLVVARLKRRRSWPSLNRLMPLGRRLSAQDAIGFIRGLASLLDAGITILPALNALRAQANKRGLRDDIEAIIHDLEVGISLSEACAKRPSIFSPLYISMLQVAEESGELRRALLAIAADMERKRSATERIRKALTYPALVLAGGVAGAFILITFTFPAMKGLFAEFGAELPVITQVLIGVSNFTDAYGVYILVGLIVIGLLCWWHIRTPRGKRCRDRLMLKMPIVGKIAKQSQMALICSTLSTLLAAGIPMVEAIGLVRNTTGNSAMQDALDDVHRDAMAGKGIESSIQEQGVFPPMFAQVVGIGSRTGAIGESLEGLATYYEGERDSGVDRAVSMIEPGVISLMGLLIGSIGIAFVSAMYSLLNQIR